MKKLMIMAIMLITTTAFSQTPAEEIQAKLNAMHTMSASFNQTVTAGKREVSQTSGMMALARPGRFRWETKSPLEQVIIADGQQLWVYDIDLQQVTVKKQDKGVGGTPGLFLSGNNTVARDFTVNVTVKNNTKTFDLHAKSNKESYQQVKLIYKGDVLNTIEFFDQLGQHTIVKLSRIKTNPKLANQLFQFKPPKGVDVVKQ